MEMPLEDHTMEVLGGRSPSRPRKEKVYCEMGSPPQSNERFEGSDFINVHEPTDVWKQGKEHIKTPDNGGKVGTSCVGRAKAHDNTKALAPRSKDVPCYIHVPPTDDANKVEKPEETQVYETSSENIIEIVDQMRKDYPESDILDIRVDGVSKVVTCPVENQLGSDDSGEASCREITCGDVLKDLQEAACQEKTCGDLSKDLQKTTISQDEICYGTAKCLEELAKKHKEFETGFHGVFTDTRFQILKTEPQEVIDSRTTFLTKGSFGEVRKCQFSADLVFVIKRVTQNFRKEEVIFTNQYEHPNIVKSFALLLKQGIPEIVMEFAGQSLLGLLNDEKSLPENTIRSLTFQLCTGLDFLESKFIIHCDIKPENIFVMGKEFGDYHLKIGDFGSAQSSEAAIEVTACTLMYMAPEMFHFIQREHCQAETMTWNILQPKSDVFSAGLVVAFLYRGENMRIKFIKAMNLEVRDVTWRKLGQAVLYAEKVENLIPEVASLEQKTVMRGMLAHDVAERYSAKETLNIIIAQEKQKMIEERDTNPPASQAVLYAEKVENLIPEVASLEQKTVMRGMLAHDVAERYSAKETLNVIIAQEKQKMIEERDTDPPASQICQAPLNIAKIMAEPKQIRKRMTKHALKRKIQNKLVETAPKIRRTSEASSQDSPNISQGGFSEASWEGHHETSPCISLEHQFPMVCVSEYRYPVCQAEEASHESLPGNMPALELLIKDFLPAK